MRFTQILHSDHGNGLIRLTLRGEDGQPYEIVTDRDVAAEIAMALQREARQMPPDDPAIGHGHYFTIVSCQTMALENQQAGIAITTGQGFEIRLAVPSPARAALRTCLDGLDAGIRHAGPIH